MLVMIFAKIAERWAGIGSEFVVFLLKISCIQDILAKLYCYRTVNLEFGKIFASRFCFIQIIH
jgi:hypothetical protein